MPISVGASGAHKAVLGVWVGAGGVWKLGTVYAGAGGAWKQGSLTGSFSGTFTATNGLDGGGTGYIGLNVGSTSPSTDSNGKTPNAVFDSYSGFFPTGTELHISGFSADPGQSYFTTAVINGQSLSSASAFYGYSAGVAVWSWAGSTSISAGTGRTLTYS